ncbi:MAG: hypothetical protein CTY20_05475 [Hyphomicrobium sp.]|nr:MAG: hypothetical protein CTY20_05475 [Hyphomicrobium sp.]
MAQGVIDLECRQAMRSGVQLGQVRGRKRVRSMSCARAAAAIRAALMLFTGTMLMGTMVVSGVVRGNRLPCLRTRHRA